MKPIPTLPPRWPGIAMILAGILGLIFVVHPQAAGIALLVVICCACLLSALGALAAVVAAGQADKAMGQTEDEISESGRLYADECMRKIRRDEAEAAASAVIGDDQ